MQVSVLASNEVGGTLSIGAVQYRRAVRAEYRSREKFFFLPRSNCSCCSCAGRGNFVRTHPPRRPPPAPRRPRPPSRGPRAKAHIRYLFFEKKGIYVRGMLANNKHVHFAFLCASSRASCTLNISAPGPGLWLCPGAAAAPGRCPHCTLARGERSAHRPREQGRVARTAGPFPRA